MHLTKNEFTKTNFQILIHPQRKQIFEKQKQLKIPQKSLWHFPSSIIFFHSSSCKLQFFSNLSTLWFMLITCWLTWVPRAVWREAGFFDFDEFVCFPGGLPHNCVDFTAYLSFSLQFGEFADSLKVFLLPSNELVSKLTACLSSYQPFLPWGELSHFFCFGLFAKKLFFKPFR